MVNSSRTVPAVLPGSAHKVLLSTRSHIDKLDAGLQSIAGAREVISTIQNRRVVSKLVLGHNDLGDEGCRELFRYLCSNDGRRYKISEISLNANEIGDAGLCAVADYLPGNAYLKELFLQNNAFQGDPEAVIKFTSALNASRIEVLSLVTNQELSDPFLSLFLSHLDAPYLHELHLSAIGLTSSSTPTITSFLASPRSRPLETLKCNGNFLGLPSVRTIIQTIRKSNFTILKLELYANSLQHPQGNPASDGSDGRSNQWEDCEKELKRVLLRNELLKKRTADMALALLPYARALLLTPSRHCQSPSHNPPVPSAASHTALAPSRSSPSHDSNARPPHPTFPFHALPTELQLHILSFMAPALSSCQLVRIFNHASSPSTLPLLLPRLTNGCIPDPSTLPFGMSKARTCSGGHCMGPGGSVLCHRNQEKMKWLAEVGCARFELDEQVANRDYVDLL